MASFKILIVADDPAMARDLEGRLTALGHGVSAVVTSGREALAAVDRDRPDLVLADLGSADRGGGLEAAYRIRYGHGVPVVLLIDSPEDRLPERTEMAFPSGYITRPYQDGEIEIAVKRAVRLDRPGAGPGAPGPALTESETRYQNILDTIEDGYYEVDLAGTMIVASESLCRLYGYTKEEFLGLNYRDYTAEETAQKVFETYHQVFTTGQPVKKMDWEIIRRNGTKGQTEVSVSLIRDEHGQGIGFRGIVRDVTDRWLAEQALRASEERYRSILSNIEDAYYEVDLAGNHVLFSESLVRMYGYSREELTGMNYRTYIHEDYLDEVYRTFNRVYTTGEPATGFDWETVTKDGSTIHIEASVSLVKDARGEAVGFRGIVRDITERYRAEQALKESEERYRSIFSNIEDAYFEVDLAGNLTFFNDALCRLYGYSPEELRGMSYKEYIHPDYLDDVYQTYHRVFTTGQPVRVSGWEYVTKDGARRYVEASITLIRDVNGQGIGFQGIVRDVTERQQAEQALRESEERYRLLAEEAQDVIWSIDLKTMRFTQISPSVERLLGLTVAEALGLDFAEVFGPELTDLVREALAIDGTEADPAQQDHRRMTEFQLHHRDGRTIWIEATIAFYRDDAGRPLGVVGVARDVTARKRAEEEREELITTLQQTLTEVKTLSGLLPICANCKKVRDDSGYWQQIESYVSRHSQAQFSHGICPDCMKKLYPEEYERLRLKNPELFDSN
jgi:PAS domain S-box-containing protein